MSKSFWTLSPKSTLQSGLSDTQAHLQLVRLYILLAYRTTVTFPTVLGPFLSVLLLPASSVNSSDTLLQMPHSTTQKLPILCSTHEIICSYNALHDLSLCHQTSWTTIPYLPPRIPFPPFLSSWKTVVITLCLWTSSHTTLQAAVTHQFTGFYWNLTLGHLSLRLQTRVTFILLGPENGCMGNQLNTWMPDKWLCLTEV